MRRSGVQGGLAPTSPPPRTTIPNWLTVPLFLLGVVCMFYVHNVYIAVSHAGYRHTETDGLLIPTLPVGFTTGESHAWDVVPLRVMLQTHVGSQIAEIDAPASRSNVSGPTHTALPPHRASISVILDTPPFDAFGHVKGVVQHAPAHSNVFVYVGLPVDVVDRHTEQQFYKVLQNLSVSTGTSVDFFGMGIPSHTKQQTRMFRLAAHALSQNRIRTYPRPGGGDSILILHRSCVADVQWDVSNLARRGRGFLLLHGSVSYKELYTEIAEHDLGLASGSIGSHRHPVFESHFHCTGNIMHALSPRVKHDS